MSWVLFQVAVRLLSSWLSRFQCCLAVGSRTGAFAWNVFKVWRTNSLSVCRSVPSCAAAPAHPTSTGSSVLVWWSCPSLAVVSRGYLYFWVSKFRSMVFVTWQTAVNFHLCCIQELVNLQQAGLWEKVGFLAKELGCLLLGSRNVFPMVQRAELLNEGPDLGLSNVITSFILPCITKGVCFQGYSHLGLVRCYCW